MYRMADDKVKKVCLTIQDRCNILQRLENGTSSSQLADEFKVTRQAINVIKKRANKIKNAKQVLENCDGDLRRKRYRGVEESELDQKLFEWFKQCRSMGLPISGPILKKKALLYNKLLGGKENFVASDGWLTRFKTRHGIKQKNIQGEKLSADFEGSEEFVMKLKNIRQVAGIALDYIYNCDETGLYWKAEPNKTFVTRQEKRAEGRKKPKNRLTVLLCTNASGTHKLPLFVIGKSAQPRCLKGIKIIPVCYDHQENAWMTCELMTKWYSSVFLPEVTRKHDLHNNKNVKIILLMDNAGCHPPAEELNRMCANITILYLPPNVTSLIQPLDQGIIEQFKRRYKKNFIEQLVIEDDFRSSQIFLHSFNLLDCLHFCKSAWDQVTPENIRNCWKTLLPLEDDCTSSSNIESIDAKSFQDLLVKIPAYKNLSVDDINNWLDADLEEVGWRPRSDEDIIQGRYSNDFIKDAVEELDDKVAYEDDNCTPTDSILDNTCPTFIEAFIGVSTFLQWYRIKGENSDLGLQCFEKAHEELTKMVFSK